MIRQIHFVVFLTLVSLCTNSLRAESEAVDPLQVRTIKVSKSKSKKYHGIKLVSPPHKCLMSTGVLTFEWEFKNKKGKEAVVELENLQTGKKLTLKAKRLTRRFYIQEGLYRWRVKDEKNKLDSQWRSFKAVELQAREVSSVPPTSPSDPEIENDSILDSLPKANILKSE